MNCCWWAGAVNCCYWTIVDEGMLMSWYCWTVDDELVLLNVCWWLLLLNYCWWDGVVQRILMSWALGILGTPGAGVTELLVIQYWWSIELMLMNSCDELMSFMSGWYTLVPELRFLKCWRRADVANCGDELMSLSFWWRYDTNELMSRDGVAELIWISGVLVCWTDIDELALLHCWW